MERKVERFYSKRKALSVSIHRPRKNSMTIVLFILEIGQNNTHVSPWLWYNFLQFLLCETVQTQSNNSMMTKQFRKAKAPLHNFAAF